MRILFFLLLVFLSVNSWAATCSTSRVSISSTGDACHCEGEVQVCEIVSTNYSGSASCSSTNGGRCGYGVNVIFRGTGQGTGYYQSCSIYYAIGATVEVNLTRCESDGCDDLQAECSEVGGTFHGTMVSDNGQSCCRASCNVCNSKAMNNMYNAKTKICCESGLAPPIKDQTCNTVSMPTSGCGMVYSSYGDFSSGGWQCADPSSSFEAGSRYGSMCLNRSSSSGDPGSSSGGGSSSSGAGDCRECEILEEILDTLTHQKSTVEDIYLCVSNPSFCGQTQDSLTIPEWVKDELDSLNDKNQKQIDAIKKVDTTLLSILDIDSALLVSDSLTRKSIVSGVGAVDSAVGAAADSVMAWIQHVADSLHITKRQLINHLDSIRSAIPNDILDSIVKYQKTALDDFDSAFYGSNSGFKKIDNLMDSAVKYFQEGLRHDSIYYANYGDSLAAIHGAIENLSGSIEGVGDKILYGLGYGDTASSTLRDDLRGYFTGASVDTHGVNYGSNWVANGERMGDSIVNSLGWGGIRNMNIDSIYSHALDGSRMDSVSQSIDDSLSGVAANLNDSLAARTDSLKRQLPTLLDSMADSLVIWAPFADFDSIIYSTIGAHIPNRSDCPEDCQKWTVSIPIIGLYSYTVDFGLCLGRATFGGLSVLGFLKLLIRVIVAYACIMTAYKVLVRMI